MRCPRHSSAGIRTYFKEKWRGTPQKAPPPVSKGPLYKRGLSALRADWGSPPPPRQSLPLRGRCPRAPAGAERAGKHESLPLPQTQNRSVIANQPAHWRGNPPDLSEGPLCVRRSLLHSSSAGTAKAPYPQPPSSPPNRNHFIGFRFGSERGCLRFAQTGGAPRRSRGKAAAPYPTVILCSSSATLAASGSSVYTARIPPPSSTAFASAASPAS